MDNTRESSDSCGSGDFWWNRKLKPRDSVIWFSLRQKAVIFLRSAGSPQEIGTGLGAALKVTGVIVKIFLALLGEVWKNSETWWRTCQWGSDGKMLPSLYALLICPMSFVGIPILHLIWWSNSFQLYSTFSRHLISKHVLSVCDKCHKLAA